MTITPSEFIRVIEKVESDFIADAIGDAGKAYGILQIWQAYLSDVNQFSGTDYKLSDLINNVVLSEWVFWQYMHRYARKDRLGREVTYQDMARIHNGGPEGWKKQGTAVYWEKCRSVCRELGFGII